MINNNMIVYMRRFISQPHFAAKLSTSDNNKPETLLTSVHRPYINASRLHAIKKYKPMKIKVYRSCVISCD